MKPLNYLNFSVAMGFFLGLAVSIAKFDEPEIILFWTVVSTIGFYLIVMLIVSVYTWSLDFNHKIFDKKLLEKRLDYFDKEFDSREKEAQDIKHYLKSFDFDGNM
ncbi:hypothetical protein [Helicobacter mustelae]|uniref:Motility integral membrane protein n=1 Tax=Helicobacter mustelae (strain ATCC 43772 / CCUG 25715 / CIP 103759 / LMG 18044 / NCTC 12198 / R85-136P) TaxID=679897 RepID=D3UJ58_HELM1|nr:hypothetical protein [Helicobacter mustelae]CBG40533.1 Putative hypothetical protein [Helicobacter mustelae 12198]SQH72031.1 putative integral membrane protein [Helicobacter mustelae]STP13174.1 putative integral membrane protein [Helicobacter mustelae]